MASKVWVGLPPTEVRESASPSGGQKLRTAAASGATCELADMISTTSATTIQGRVNDEEPCQSAVPLDHQIRIWNVTGDVVSICHLAPL